MKTKIILRIVVTVVVLGLVALGVWLIWFRPTSELEVFNALNKFIEGDDLKDFKTTTAFVKDNYNSINYNNSGESNPDKIINNDYYDYMFGTDKGLDKAFVVVEDSFKYYYAYTQLSEKVSSSDVKNINKKIDNLVSSYDKFDSFKSSVEILRKNLNNSENSQTTTVNEIKNLFKSLHKQYVTILSNYESLTLTLKDYINKYVFDGKIAYTKETVYYDVVLNSINALSKKEVSIENQAEYVDFATQVYHVSTIDLNTITDDTVTSYSALITDNLYKSQAITGANNIFDLSQNKKVALKAELDADTDNGDYTSVYNRNSLAYIDEILTVFYC